MKKKISGIMLLLAAAVFALSACGSSGGSSSGGGGGGGGGGKTILAHGGSSSVASANSSGGDGAYMYMETYGDINIKSSGSADTSYTYPTEHPDYVAGAVELIVTSDLTIPVFMSGSTITVDSYYLLPGNRYIQHDSDGDGVAEGADNDVVSITIAKGATLTLEPNYDRYLDGDSNEYTGADEAQIYLDGDLNVDGTLKVDVLANSKGTPDSTYALDSANMEIYAHQIFVGPNGSILARGGDSTTGDGGDGGYIWLYADQNDGGYLINNGTIDCSGGSTTATGFDGGDGYGVYSDGCYLWSDGVLINNGTVAANGGNGDNGGDAAYVELEADTHVYNRGAMEGNGGTGSAGRGGSGELAGIYSYYGTVVNDGDISINGGDGTTGGGSVNSGIDIYADTSYAVGIVSKGTVSTKGGDATTDGDGGTGGYLYYYAAAGGINVDGSLVTAGGDGMLSGNGGDGGYVEFYVDTWYSDLKYGEYIPLGDLTVSADIDASGGDGVYAGDADYVYFYSSDYLDEGLISADLTDNEGRATDINLLGYASIDLSGGDAVGGDAGHAKYSEAYIYQVYAGQNDITVPMATLTNNVPLDMSGGDSVTGDGGEGGVIYWEMDGDMYTKDSGIVNTASIDISGGKGDFGGEGNFIYWYGYNIKNSGAINADGGDGTTDGGDSLNDRNSSWCCENGIEIFATWDLSNSGAISANGGDGGDGDGGTADNNWLALYTGGQVINSGAISANGGSGNAATGTGGDGGWLELFSQSAPTYSSGKLMAQGGSASTDGSNGTILIDWVDVTGADATHQ